MQKILPILLIFLLSCNISTNTININEIDLYEFQNLHFLDIYLNGKKCRLLVDTGASKSLLDISKAGIYEFSYLIINKDKYIGLGGKTDIYIVYDYNVKPFHISFLGTDLSEITGFFDENNMPIVGVLGIDFLENNKSKIDFKSNKIFLNQDY